MGLGDVTGSLEPGKEADLVIIETDSPTCSPYYDPYSTLVYSAFASNVRDVYVAGECLVGRKTAGKRRSDGCPDGVKREDGTDEI